MPQARGKKYKEAAKAIERTEQYAPDDAVRLVLKSSTSKFDGSIEAHLRLGVDPRHADQMVRGSVVLPHGTGKKRRVLVFATGEKAREATVARLRRRACDPRHDGPGRPPGQDSGAARTDAEPARGQRYL